MSDSVKYARLEPTTCGKTSSGTITTAAAASRTRPGARYSGLRAISIRDSGTSLRFGMTNSATKSTTNGSDAGTPESQLTSPTYFVERADATPISTPPTNVNGMLLNAPIAAAPKACTTRNVRMIESSPTIG